MTDQNQSSEQVQTAVHNKARIHIESGIGGLGKDELIVLQYRIENEIRARRIKAARLAVVAKSDDILLRYEYDRLITEVRNRRNIFIDDILDRLESEFGLILE